jgi:hypothetical protein
VSETQPKSNLRWLLVAQLYIASLLWGIVQVFTQHAGLYFLFAIIMATASALWTVSDARSRGRPVLHIVQLFLFLFWPIAIPIYLVLSRGIRGFGWSLLHAVGLMAALYLGFYITVFSVYGLDAYSAQP